VNRLSPECDATVAKLSKPMVCIHGLPDLLSIQTSDNVSLRCTFDIVLNAAFGEAVLANTPRVAS